MVHTADRRSAVVYLYDAAIRALRQAADAIEDGRVAEKGRRLDQAMAAVVELAGALDLESGGELARRLNLIYSFVIRALIAANSGNNPTPAREGLAVLRTLREGWEQVALGRAPEAVRNTMDASHALRC